MDLSVVIVSWNCVDHLERALASLEPERAALAMEVFVVDNASDDGTVERVAAAFGWVEMIANDDNRGFAAANNQALRRASGRHAILLNPDTEVHPGALRTLVDHLDGHPEVGAVGPRLIYPDGRLQRSSTLFPTMRGALHRFTAVRYLRLFRRHYRRYKMKDATFDAEADVDSLMGAALMVRREALDAVGLLDEGFWMYYEEVDLCKRIAAAGYVNRFVPSAVILHVGGESSSRNMERIKIERLRSLIRYFDKHRPGLPSFAFRVVFKAAFLLRMAVDLVRDLALWLLWRVLGDRDRIGLRAERLGLAAAFWRRDVLVLLRSGGPWTSPPPV